MFEDVWGILEFFGQILRFLVKITWFLSFSSKNDAESLCHFVKIPFLDPKRAKLDQNSDFRHLRTSSWRHKLRNTQGKIHVTYLGNIYGIYKECITNISIDTYDITINIHKYIHQTHRPNGAAAEGGACVSHGYLWIFMVIS